MGLLEGVIVTLYASPQQRGEWAVKSRQRPLHKLHVDCAKLCTTEHVLKPLMAVAMVATPLPNCHATSN